MSSFSFTVLTVEGPWVITDYSALQSTWAPREHDNNIPSLPVGEVTDLASKKDARTDRLARTLLCAFIQVISHRDNQPDYRSRFRTKAIYVPPERAKNQSDYDFLQVDIAVLKERLRKTLATLGYVSYDASYLLAEHLLFPRLNGGGLACVRMFVTYPNLFEKKLEERILADMEAVFAEQETVTADENNPGWKSACEVLTATFPSGLLGVVQSFFFKPLKFQKSSPT